MAVADDAHPPAPAPMFRSAARSCAAMLKSGSLDIFFPVSVDLPRIATAFLHTVEADWVSGFRTSSSSVSGVPFCAILSSVWSSTGFWPPPVQDDQFFQ